MSIAERLMAYLERSGTSMPDSALKNEFGAEYQQLEGVCNELLAQHRIALETSADGTLWYQAVQSEKAAKMKDLTPEQHTVYQQIKLSGNSGIWVRDIKLQTNIQQVTINKALKGLESRSLIKSVKAVHSKSKKLYMLFELTPSTEVTGGIWYTQTDFDHGFISSLSEFVRNTVREAGGATLDYILNKLRTSGVSKVELSPEHVLTIVKALVYDGILAEVYGPTSGGSGTVYKLCRDVFDSSYLTDTPCGMCPVIDHCTENGVISPQTCAYMENWLKMNSTLQRINRDLMEW